MTTGSNDTDDHFVVTDDTEVERLLVRDVAAPERAAFRAELSAVAPYELNPLVRARIHLAMLFVADGDLSRLKQARQLADRDWRDLLMQAEYPSTPPFGTIETAEEKKTRQQRDIDAMNAFRTRSGPG